MRERTQRPWAFVAVLGALDDWTSRRALIRSRIAGRAGPPEPPLLRLKVRALAGGELLVRPRTTDISTIVHDYVEGEHLPPQPLRDQELTQICELGSNIGTGLAGLAFQYPRARILGVEPDPANAALARRNIAAFGDRCHLVEAAIWDAEAMLTIDGKTHSGLAVAPVEGPTVGGQTRVRAWTVDTLLAVEMPHGDIDYVILNLEGAEPRVLADGGNWPIRVRSIRVELHPKKGFGGDECRRLLQNLGFYAWIEPDWWGGWGFGLRRP